MADAGASDAVDVTPKFSVNCAECDMRVTIPVNESCMIFGEMSTGVVKFLCKACSPSKGHQYVSMEESKWVERATTKCNAATKTRDEALEALMQEGRVKEDFTAKMTGLANDFVKAAVAAEKATAVLDLFMGTNTETDVGTKRRRT